MRHSTESVFAVITRPTVWHRLLSIRWRLSNVGRLLIWITALVLLLGQGVFAQVPKPVFEPSSGIFSLSAGASQFDVNITCATPNATIRYTTDGTDPTVGSSAVVGGKVTIDRNIRLKTKAWDAVGNSSETASAMYNIAHAVAAGDFHTMAVNFTGKLRTWGRNTQGRLGLGNADSPKPTPQEVNQTQVATGVIAMDGGADDEAATPRAHSVLLKDDGTVWSVGSGVYGRLGNDTPLDSLLWVQVVTSNTMTTIPLTGIRAVAAGNSVSYALSADGYVYSWGRNTSAAPRLGQGYTGDEDEWTAHRVKTSATVDLDRIVAIAAGDNHAIALRDDGTVWAWGANDVGQIGDNGGATAHRAFAVQVQAGETNANPGLYLTGIKAIAAGAKHSIAVTSAGTVVGWGESANGRLGNGSAPTTSTPKRRPVYVTSSAGGNFANVHKVAAGGNTTLFIKTDASLYACGGNGQHQLGDGTTTNRPNPVPVKNNGNFLTPTIIDAAAGTQHCIALAADGTIYTWGFDNSGQVGDGVPSATDTIYATNSPSTHPNLINPEADNDGDGLVDVEETMFETDPAAGSKPPVAMGNFQMGPANTVMANPLVRYVGPTPGIPVTFTVNAGAGQLRAESGSLWSDSVTVFSDASGFARAYWQLGKHGSTDNTVTTRIGIGTPVTFTSRSADLVARWKLDEGAGTVAQDSSGTDYDAGVSVLPINPSPFPTYPWETSFDGSGSFKTTGRYTGPGSSCVWHANSNNEVIEQTGPFTISFWFKADTLTPGILNWLANCEQTGVSGFRCGIGDAIEVDGVKQGRVKFWTTSSGGNVFLVAPTPIMEKRWYNLSIVHTGSETQIYIDWTLVVSAPGSIQRGTNVLFFASCNAGGYELNGEIDDIKVYTAAVPPAPPVDVAYNSRLMIEIPPESDFPAEGVKFANGTGNRAGNVLIYKPYESSRGFATYETGSPAEQVPVPIKIVGPQGGASAKPRYQRTVIVHKSTPTQTSTKQFDLEIDDPDQHGFTVTSVSLSPGDYDFYDSIISGRKQLGDLRVGTKLVNNTHITYTAPDLVGEVRLTYTGHDSLTGVPSTGTVVIHVVRPVYLTASTDPNYGQNLPLNTDEATESSITCPYRILTASDHTNLIANNKPYDLLPNGSPDPRYQRNRQYTVYYYEPGTYLTKGYELYGDGNPNHRSTANDGCKHYHVKYSPDYTGNTQAPAATLKLVDASLPNGDGIIFAADPVYNTHGFEVRGLTLDCNGQNNPKFQSGLGLIGAIACQGSNIIISETTVKGCGGSIALVDEDGPAGPIQPHFPENVNLECFPILLAGAPRVVLNPYSTSSNYRAENIIVEDCRVEQYAPGSNCYITAILIVPTKVSPSPSLSNGVIRRCTIGGSQEIYVQGGFAPLVEDCTYSGSNVGVYIEPPGEDIVDFEAPIVIRRNTFENTGRALFMHFLGPTLQNFTGGVSFEDNLITIGSAGGSAVAVLYNPVIPNAPTEAYIETMHVHGNVVRARPELSSTSYIGFSFGLCTNLEEGTANGLKIVKIRNVDCSENLFDFANNQELLVHWESTIDAFQNPLYPFHGNFRLTDQLALELVPVIGQNGPIIGPHPTITQVAE